mmetsp:Transcript_31363/g.63608  ORF Transcript_31363/g.63608 Transcript_31363/m.63608 type:complete len:132 (-) Transcript_31363:751-1146(-)
MKQKKICPSDLISILELIYKSGVKFFDRKIPIALLKVFYKFLWNIFYQARLLSKHKKKKKILFEDINSVCKQTFLRIVAQKKALKKNQLKETFFNIKLYPRYKSGWNLDNNNHLNQQFQKENLRLKQKKKN